jgi:hypothetical protein
MKRRGHAECGTKPNCQRTRVRRRGGRGDENKNDETNPNWVATPNESMTLGLSWTAEQSQIVKEHRFMVAVRRGSESKDDETNPG